MGKAEKLMEQQAKKLFIDWYDTGISIGLIALSIVCVAILIVILDIVFQFAAFETLTVLYSLLGIEIILAILVFIVMLLDERSSKKKWEKQKS